MNGSTGEHRSRAAADVRTRGVVCAVLTVSDTRTAETDSGGARVVELLEEAGHSVARRGIVRDEPAAIGAWLDAALADEKVLSVLTTGGTGIAKRDTTIEVVRSRFTAELEGFGELFRMVSYGQIGAAAMLSRATAGLVRSASSGKSGTLVFAMPGSLNAVETAMRSLIVPELSHLAWEMCR